MRVGHYLKALFPVGIGSPRITDVAEAVEVNAAGHEHGNENRSRRENKLPEPELAAAEQSDCLDDTLDYSAVYKIVASEMATPSNLLENVAFRIRAAIGEAYPAIPEFEISVSKKNPPVGGSAAEAKVTLKGGCVR